MKEGDPQETSEQPTPSPTQDAASNTTTNVNGPINANTTSSSTPSTSTSNSTSSTSTSASTGTNTNGNEDKDQSPASSSSKPQSSNPTHKLRTSGIFKTANLSGVINLNNLPPSSLLNTNANSSAGNPSLHAPHSNNSSDEPRTKKPATSITDTSDTSPSSSSSSSTSTSSTSSTSHPPSHPSSSSSSYINGIAPRNSTAPNINIPPSSNTANSNASFPQGGYPPNSLYTPSPGSILRSSSSSMPATIDKDLLCPICLDVMNEAFISRCGHSFCYSCIVKHLANKQNCPCCSVYLTRDLVFPNFIFNKIVEKSKAQPSNSLLSSSTMLQVKQLQTTILTDSTISINEIETIMQALVDKKKLLEAEDQSIEMEVLLDFLNATKRRKREALELLQKELAYLDSDIERVSKLRDSVPSQDLRKRKRTMDEGRTEAATDGDVAESPRYANKESLEHQKKREAIAAKKVRVEEHLEDLQSCYFESCKKIDDDKGDDGRVDRYNSNSLSRFVQNMNKFTKYSNFKVLGTLRYGDIYNQSSIVSSIEFDRDDEFFATAGVTKKIKIFDYNAIIRDTIDMHYPVSEMSCKSKISCLSWNAYIKSQIASSDYEGIVSLWDATTGQVFSQLEEHEKRVWSVDFSKCDPTQLASGSDDTKVKIWSTSQQRSVATIESKANICCVKWNPTSPYLLAFGSADHHIHYFDLRAAKDPLFVFRGHKKAVSYVKFMSKDEIVSASTDSTLKLWKNGQSECVRTFAGHTNEKNFVGLAVNGDYVCCGSENNGVYAYYKMMSKPIVGYKFGSSNPLTGEEMEDDASQFVSSVCWRKESNVLLAANSQGTIKILELI